MYRTFIQIYNSSKIKKIILMQLRYLVLLTKSLEGLGNLLICATLIIVR